MLGQPRRTEQTDDGQTEGDQPPLLFSGLAVGWGLSEQDLLPRGARREAIREPSIKGLYTAGQAAGPEKE